jgi:hypothetical protein
MGEIGAESDGLREAQSSAKKTLPTPNLLEGVAGEPENARSLERTLRLSKGPSR